MEQELQFLLYDLPDESAKVQVVVRDETVWMTQKAMGVLFGVQAPAISKHLKNIFESGELNPEVVISKMETTTQHDYAITGRTAAEIIYHSADHTQEHMGLTTWKNSPDGRSNYPKFSNSSNGRCRHVAREVKFDKIGLQQDREMSIAN